MPPRGRSGRTVLCSLLPDTHTVPGPARSALTIINGAVNGAVNSAFNSTAGSPSPRHRRQATPTTAKGSAPARLRQLPAPGDATLRPPNLNCASRRARAGA
jgi:hypothetical protein